MMWVVLNPWILLALPSNSFTRPGWVVLNIKIVSSTVLFASSLPVDLPRALTATMMASKILGETLLVRVILSSEVYWNMCLALVLRFRVVLVVPVR